MKSRIQSSILYTFGALLLAGCPIDDAKFKESSSGSSSSSSSGEVSSSSSSSSSSSGNGGVGGMGGAVASSSSGGAGGLGGSGGMGGAAGSGGMAGSGGTGGGPVCPEAGRPGSCGPANCPPCPILVMVGTGSNGVIGTFVSNAMSPWNTASYMGEPSSHVPTVVNMPGQNKVMALLRRSTDGLIRHTIWTLNAGFSGTWDQIGPALTTLTTLSAVGTDSAIHVAYRGTDMKYYYAQYTDVMGFGIKNEKIMTNPMNMSTHAFGPAPASIDFIAMTPTVVYAGDNMGLYSHVRVAADMSWPSTAQMTASNTIAGIPAIVALNPASTREGMIVFMGSKPVANQLYWLGKATGGGWDSIPTAIPGAASNEPVVLALPNGDAILVFASTNKKLFWSRFSAMTGTWSASPIPVTGDMAAKSRPALALGAGDAEVELLFVDDQGNKGYHSRLHKDEPNFTMPSLITGTSALSGIAAATNL